MDLTLEDIKEYPLSDADIRQYLPNAKIIKYSELSRYKRIDDLLPNDKDYVILLYQNSHNTGHWITILKYKNKIEHFDPYGIKPDNTRKWIPENRLILLGERDPYLTELYDNSNIDVIYNPVRYQQFKNGVNTCGRHCCFRVLCMLKEEMSLEEYNNFLQKINKELKLSYDNIISTLISKI